MVPPAVRVSESTGHQLRFLRVIAARGGAPDLREALYG